MTKLLIVEDSADVANMLATFLGREGYECMTAEDATEAQMLLRTGDFDLIILDLMMPGGTGYDLAEKVRERGKQTPMLLVTGHDGVLVEAHAHKAGINEVMHKPLDPSALAAKVGEMTGAAKAAEGRG